MTHLQAEHSSPVASPLHHRLRQGPTTCPIRTSRSAAPGRRLRRWKERTRRRAVMGSRVVVVGTDGTVDALTADGGIVTIRPATAEDRPALAALYRDATPE